jgi:hypothetical protein
MMKKNKTRRERSTEGSQESPQPGQEHATTLGMLIALGAPHALTPRAVEVTATVGKMSIKHRVEF